MLTMVLVSWGAPLKEGRFGHHGPLTFRLLSLAGYSYVRKVTSLVIILHVIVTIYNAN